MSTIINRGRLLNADLIRLIDSLSPSDREFVRAFVLHLTPRRGEAYVQPVGRAVPHDTPRNPFCEFPATIATAVPGGEPIVAGKPAGKEGTR